MMNESKAKEMRKLEEKVKNNNELDLNDPTLHFLRDDEFVLDKEACERIIAADKAPTPSHPKVDNTVFVDLLPKKEQEKYYQELREAWDKR